MDSSQRNTLIITIIVVVLIIVVGIVGYVMVSNQLGTQVAQVAPEQQPKISAFEALNATAPAPGDEVSFRLVIENPALATTSGLEIRGDYKDLLDNIKVTATPNTGVSWDDSLSQGSQLQISDIILPPESSQEIAFSATIIKTATQELSSVSVQLNGNTTSFEYLIDDAKTALGGQFITAPDGQHFVIWNEYQTFTFSSNGDDSENELAILKVQPVSLQENGVWALSGSEQTLYTNGDRIMNESGRGSIPYDVFYAADNTPFVGIRTKNIVTSQKNEISGNANEAHRFEVFRYKNGQWTAFTPSTLVETSSDPQNISTLPNYDNLSSDYGVFAENSDQIVFTFGGGSLTSNQISFVRYNFADGQVTEKPYSNLSNYFTLQSTETSHESNGQTVYTQTCNYSSLDSFEAAQLNNVPYLYGVRKELTLAFESETQEGENACYRNDPVARSGVAYPFYASLESATGSWSSFNRVADVAAPCDNNTCPSNLFGSRNGDDMLSMLNVTSTQQRAGSTVQAFFTHSNRGDGPAPLGEGLVYVTGTTSTWARQSNLLGAERLPGDSARILLPDPSISFDESGQPWIVYAVYEGKIPFTDEEPSTDQILAYLGNARSRLMIAPLAHDGETEALATDIYTPFAFNNVLFTDNQKVVLTTVFDPSSIINARGTDTDLEGALRAMLVSATPVLVDAQTTKVTYDEQSISLAVNVAEIKKEEPEQVTTETVDNSVTNIYNTYNQTFPRASGNQQIAATTGTQTSTATTTTGSTSTATKSQSVTPATVTGKAATGPKETLAIVIALLLTISVVYAVYVVRTQQPKPTGGESKRSNGRKNQ